MIDSKKALWYKSSGPAAIGLAVRGGNWQAWSGTDQEENFEQNCLDPKKKNKLKMLGFLEPNCITYIFNHQGFRCDEFDDRPAGLALGCSFTEGVGIPVDDTWPAVLSDLIGQHIWNLGIGGSAMDPCFRMLDHYIDVLNPKFVVLCQPPAQRFELFDRYNNSRVFIANHLNAETYKTFAEEWMANDINTSTNQRRNLLAMKLRCMEKNIPFFEFYSLIDLDRDSKGRDLEHPGVEANHLFAHKIYKKIKDTVCTTQELS